MLTKASVNLTMVIDAQNMDVNDAASYLVAIPYKIV
jgi:hypothetical protein